MAVFREKLIKSKLYRVILWVILFSMGGGTLLFSPMLFRQTRSARPIMLEVNGQEITYKEYEQRLSQEYENLAMLRQRYGEYAETFLKLLGFDNPQELAIKSLINEELMNQVADELNLQLSSPFVMQKLYDPTFIVQELRDVIPIQVLDPSGSINMNALRYWLQRHGQTMGDFEKNLEQALKRKIVTDLIGNATFISSQEAKQYFSSQYLKKKYDILIFPFEKYLNQVKKKPLDQKELTAFFKTENEANKRYWVPEKRSGTLWKFTPQNYGILVNDQEIEQYYTKHKQEFLEKPVQIQVRRILFKIEDGSPITSIKEKAQKVKDELEAHPDQFEKLAQEYSDDKKTAEKGGDLGFIKRGDRDSAFWRAALRLQKDGAISDLVSTEEGIEILQRVSRKAAVYQPLDKVKKEIMQILLLQKFKRSFVDSVEKIIKDKKELDDFIENKKGKKEVITQQILSDESPLSQKLFKVRKGSWGYVFDKEGSGILLRVDEIEKSHEPAFDTVRKEVEKDLYIKKAQEALDSAIKNAETKAKQQDLKSLAEDMGLEVKATDWLKKDDQEKLKKLEQEGFPVQGLFFRSDRLDSLTTAHGKDNGYIAKLEAIEPFDWILYKDKKQEINKSLSQEKKDLLTRAFVDSLFKNAKIKRIEEPRAQQPQVPLDDIF